MNKHLAAIFLLLGVSVALHAQGTGALRKMDKILAEAARYGKVPATSATRKTTTAATRLTRHMAQLEHQIHTPIPTLSPTLINPDHEARVMPQYDMALKNFADFKKEADTFLYYHRPGKTAEKIAPQEVRYWLERIEQTKNQFDQLRGEVLSSTPALIYAADYLNYLLGVVSPQTAGFAVAQKTFSRRDRTYKKNEFFLHNPHRLPNCVLHAWQCLPGTVSSHVPAGLQIAVFNDVHYFTSEMKSWHKEGTLWPEHQIVYYNDAYELLLHILHGRIHPDVIITDILSEDGFGGMGLVQELRNNHYPGVVLALTGFEEKDINGISFLNKGFDGVISNPENDFDSWLRNRLNQALENYFYYHNLNGWER